VIKLEIAVATLAETQQARFDQLIQKGTYAREVCPYVAALDVMQCLVKFWLQDTHELMQRIDVLQTRIILFDLTPMTIPPLLSRLSRA
jgi:hypothetical protein